MNNKKNKIFFLENDEEFIEKLNKYNSINNNGSLNKIIQKKYNLLFNYLLPQISLALNKLHKVDKPVYYWQIILGNWFHYFITIIIHRNFLLDHLIENKIINTDHNVEHLKITPPIDFVDFYKNTNSIEWNKILICQLIYFNNKSIALDKLKPIVKNLNDNIILNKKYTFLSIIKYFIRNVFELFIKFLPRRKKHALLLFPWRFHWIHLIFLYLFSFGRIIPHSRFFEKKLLLKASISSDVSTNLRIKFFNYLLDSDSKFETEKKIIALNIPLSILENYKKINKISLEFIKFYQSKLIVTFGSHIDNELLKNAIAEFKLNDIDIITSQHGNIPRIIDHKYHRDLETEYITGNIYLTWGWKFRKNDYPLPGSRLLCSRLKLRYYHLINKKIQGRILYILGANKKWDFIKHTYYYFDFNQKNSVNRINFLKNVPSEINQNILVRSYHYEPYEGIEDEKYLKDIIPNIKFSKKNIYYETSKSEILLFDYISTYNLEIMTINKPFLIFLNPESFYLSYAGKVFFNDLENLSILHRDYESLINHFTYIEKIGIDNWWNTISKNDKYKKILKTYANTDDNYYLSWLNLINIILKK